MSWSIIDEPRDESTWPWSFKKLRATNDSETQCGHSHATPLRLVRPEEASWRDERWDVFNKLKRVRSSTATRTTDHQLVVYVLCYLDHRWRPTQPAWSTAFTGTPTRPDSCDAWTPRSWSDRLKALMRSPKDHRGCRTSKSTESEYHPAI